MNAQSIVIVGFLTLLASSGFANEKMVLSVEDCVRIGLDNSKMLHISKMKKEAAEARASEAFTYRLPTLTLGASYMHMSEVPPFEVTISIPAIGLEKRMSLWPSIQDNYSAKLSLLQPVFTGFRLQSSVRAAEDMAEAAQKDYERERADTVFSISSAYWNLFRAIESKKVIRESLDLVNAHLKDAQNLRSQGMATRNDVLKVRVQLSEVQYLLIQTENAERLARTALNSFIGLPLDTEVEPSSRPSAPEKNLPTIESLTEKALRNRPETGAAEARIRASEAGLTLARSAWFPQLALTAEYLYSRPNPRIIPPKDRFDDTWAAGVVLTYDIWTWGRTRHQTAQARAQLEQARDALGQLKDAVVLEMTQVYLDLVNSLEKIEVTEEGVKQAKESYRITKEGYTNGVIRNSELQDAEVALMRARLNYTQALVDFEVSRARLRKAVGEETFNPAVQ